MKKLLRGSQGRLMVISMYWLALVLCLALCARPSSAIRADPTSTTLVTSVLVSSTPLGACCWWTWGALGWANAHFFLPPRRSYCVMGNEFIVVFSRPSPRRWCCDRLRRSGDLRWAFGDHESDAAAGVRVAGVPSPTGFPCYCSL